MHSSGSALRVGTFHVDATPPLGSPVAYAAARSITDPLSARGVVLLGAGAPIVLCAVDWIGIGRSAQLVWRDRLAAAAGTTADRVAVHTVHQHDAPRCDFLVDDLLAGHGLGGTRYDTPFALAVLDRLASAVTSATDDARPLTGVGIGSATVDRVASNRRLLGPDGRVAAVRLSRCTDPAIVAAPEGTIDPLVRMVSLWHHDTPVAVLSTYACHPQSHYGQGDVTAEWVGLARALREAAVPQALHVHFTGAAGNVAAGKYNDGEPERRGELRDRLADGMRRAWDATVVEPVTAADIEWRTVSARLPIGDHVDRAELRRRLDDPDATVQQRLQAATGLAFLLGSDGDPIPLSALRLSRAHLLCLPGEPFVEYQLAAQALRPDDLVAVAGYGDYSPGYLGTAVAYDQGGYETQPTASWVAPTVEAVLLDGIGQLLA